MKKKYRFRKFLAWFIVSFGLSSLFTAMYPFFSTRMISDIIDERDPFWNYYSWVLQDVNLALLIALGLLLILSQLFSAIFYAKNKKLESGDSKNNNSRFFIPFEIGLAAAFAEVYALVEMMTYVVVCSTYPDAVKAFAEYFFMDIGSAYMWIYVLNIIGVGAAFGVLYVLSAINACLWVIGPIEFFKKRMLIGIIIRQLYRFVKKFYHFLKKAYKNAAEFIFNSPLDKKSDFRIALLVALQYVFLILLEIIFQLMFRGWIEEYSVLFIFFAAIYSVALYIAAKKFLSKTINQYRQLLKANEAIASGNLEYETDSMDGIFSDLAKLSPQIRDGIRESVNQQLQSQRMRNELITNVSHDLKTPLTAIITYIDLLKNDALSIEDRQSYLQTLEKKTTRMSALIEDLFEVSKANSKDITLNLETVDIVSLLKQVSVELSDRIADCGIDFRYLFPEEKILLTLDGFKASRIFENLFINIIKYAMPKSRAYVSVEKKGNKAVVELKNISADEIKVSPDELTERFVRGDESRNIEGSGLGLAIVKSYADVLNAALDIFVDGDLFKVTLGFDLPTPSIA